MGEIDRFERLHEMFDRIVGQTNRELGQNIDLPSATTQFNSLLNSNKTQSKGNEPGSIATDENQIDASERQARNAQMEGFMLLYDIFRPLTKDYLD